MKTSVDFGGFARRDQPDLTKGAWSAGISRRQAQLGAKLGCRIDRGSTESSPPSRRGCRLLARRDRYCSASKCRLLGELRKWAVLARNGAVDPKRAFNRGLNDDAAIKFGL